MPTAPHPTIDPLAAFTTGAFVAGTTRPCPLVATCYDVIIDAGLAVVTMSRTFRNGEAGSIEATITFPVPVHATLFALEVRTGERVLKAQAQRKGAARASYEDAVERGKTAVLHEEVLRGVHMLSVGHIAPGAPIEVRATFAMTLTNIDGRARLRIPLTVGDIYGRSGLSDCDDLIHGGPLQSGTLTVDCRDGTATLLGGALQDGKAEIALNAPIEIDVAAWSPRDLCGRAADGSTVALRIAPYAGGESALDLALLLDHSGSMAERCSTPQGGLTKHAAALAALASIDRLIGPNDAVDLWEFADDLRHVGSTASAPLRDLVQRLDAPDGGTEIGRALEGVLSRASAPDLLVVTDGKSYALDVLALARSGRRFSVVLVGADSLEANVGHLAALTGGEIFVAAGPDLTSMLDAAVRSLRSPGRPEQTKGAVLHERRAGMELTASWRAADEHAAATQGIEARAVAALAASIVMPTLSDEEAAVLAEAEGLVTHLTSLVLVDEASVAQPGIPGTRKIALPTPATADDDALGRRRLAGVRTARASAAYGSAALCMPPAAMRARAKREEDASLEFRSREMRQARAEEARSAAEAEAKQRAERRLLDALAPAREAVPPAKAKSRRKFEVRALRRNKRSLIQWYKDLLRQPPAPVTLPELDIDALSRRIDWDSAPQRLLTGDLSLLAADIVREIRELAAEPVIVRAAKQLGLAPVMLAIALLGRMAAPRNRTADRITRTILGDRSTDDIERHFAPHSREAAPVS